MLLFKAGLSIVILIAITALVICGIVLLVKFGSIILQWVIGSGVYFIKIVRRKSNG